jgi:hypothetical protein
MSFTVRLATQVSYSETLVRDVGPETFASWRANNRFDEVISVAAATSINLSAATTYIISADPLAPVVVGWVFNSHTVEIPVNQLTIIAPPATPYLRNPSSTGNAVPVKVLAIS